MLTGFVASVFAMLTNLMFRCVSAAGDGTMVVVVAELMIVLRSFGVMTVPSASTHDV